MRRGRLSQGLRGDHIPLIGRIVALADIYDALRSSRSYKPAFSHEQVHRIITEGDGRVEPNHFDPHILEIFQEYHGLFAAIYEEVRDE